MRFHDLVEEGFDPRLTAAEARGQASVDPLVLEHITDLRDSDLLAVVHPNCWGAPPAIMKGWIDRVFAPNAAYGFAKGEDQGDAPVGLLTTKVALVINTGNTPLNREREAFGDPLERMWRDCVLGYCGVGAVIRSLFGVVATTSGRGAPGLADRGQGAGGHGAKRGRLCLAARHSGRDCLGGPRAQKGAEYPGFKGSNSDRAHLS